MLVPVAQLDKAPDYESGDWGFKSLLGYIFGSVVVAFLNLCADSETCFAVYPGGHRALWPRLDGRAV